MPILHETIPYNWACRDYQKPLWDYLRLGGKRAVACWHRRSGKDEVALHWTAVAAIKRPATYWHLLPEASQARKAIWDAVNPHSGKRRIDEAFPLFMRETTREQEMMIKFKNGSTWQVVGSDNYNSLVGSPPAGVVFSEWSLANPLAWGYLRPILRENGGWALFIYTSRGANHGKDTFMAAKDNSDWFAELLDAEHTTVFTKDSLRKEKAEMVAEHGETVGNALFEQEYYCSFEAAVLGSVYGSWVTTARNTARLVKKLYDPLLPVHTAWDLGLSDATAVWFYQIVGNEIHLIDYFEESGLDPQQCCEYVYGQKIEVDKINPHTFAITEWHFADDLPDHSYRKQYKYIRHYLPHDGAYKLQTARGRSFAQQIYEFGLKSAIIQATNQETAIQATRKLFAQCWFDEDLTKVGINALSNYRFKYDEEKKVLSKQPLHDWSSHGSKAFEIIGRMAHNVVEDEPKEKPRFLHEITANELFFPEKTGVNYRERI